MKKTFLALLALAAAGSAAEAKCSKASLEGNWVLIYSSSSTAYVTISNGVLSTNLIGPPIKVALGKNCRGIGSMTQGMDTYPVRIATERISPTSSLKPNILMLSIEYTPASGTGYILYRKN